MWHVCVCICSFVRLVLLDATAVAEALAAFNVENPVAIVTSAIVINIVVDDVVLELYNNTWERERESRVSY